MKKYTIQVTYQDGPKATMLEIKNQAPLPGEDLTDWLTKIRTKFYTTGFNLNLGEGRIRLISPFHVHSVIIQTQQEKPAA